MKPTVWKAENGERYFPCYLCCTDPDEMLWPWSYDPARAILFESKEEAEKVVDKMVVLPTERQAVVVREHPLRD